jgi:hypothetical protein
LGPERQEKMAMDDEMLMAFADSELDGEAAAVVAAAVAADPALAARLAAFRHSRAAVAAAFGALPKAPVPDPIADRIRALAAEAAAPSNVVALPQRRTIPIWQLPIAASIALVAGLTAGHLLLPAPGTTTALLDDPEVASALTKLPSGARMVLDNGAQVALIATFENGDRVICREFEFDQPDGVTTVAVACRTEAAEAAWDLRLAIAADAGAEGYAPASSLEALDAWLVATGAGAPLSAEEEAAALRFEGL